MDEGVDRWRAAVGEIGNKGQMGQDGVGTEKSGGRGNCSQHVKEMKRNSIIKS